MVDLEVTASKAGTGLALAMDKVTEEALEEVTEVDLGKEEVMVVVMVGLAVRLKKYSLLGL